MKKFMIAAVAALMMTACGNDDENRAKIEVLENERSLLLAKIENLEAKVAACEEERQAALLIEAASDTPVEAPADTEAE